MATVNIYNTTVRGSLVMTGNAVLIFPEGGNYANPIPAPPSGSVVNNYLQSGSSAVITIPNTSTMFNTKLVWAGVTGTAGGLVIPPNLNKSPITLTTPQGNNISISPNLTWQQTFTITGNALAYVNIADITTFVSTNPNGYYTVRGIPSLAQFFAGWIMYVTYTDDNEPFRDINIWSLLSQINAGQPPVDINVSGFKTPTAGNVTGKIILAAGNGQPQLSGENVLFGPNTSNLFTLSGPNNPVNNFFQSQINNNLGFLDKNGTFGNRNTPLGQSPSNGDRTLWDITRVDASPGLTTNQTTAVIRTTTSFDSYWISSIGLQVDVNAANLSPITKTVSKAYADIGDTLIYRISFGNSGLVDAFNTILTDTIPTGQNFLPGTVFINGVQSQNSNPITGIYIPTVPGGGRVTVTFNTLVTTIPSPNPMNNIADVGYDYSNSSGTGTIHSNICSNIVSTQVNHVDLGSIKYVSKAYATIGDILTYTIPIRNIGNTTANNVVFIDTIPIGTSFISSSLTENGTSISGNINPPGASLKDIGALRTSTISFRLAIVSIPIPNPILNSSTTIFSYTINPISIPNTTATSSTNSNIVSTKVNYVDFNDIVKYTSTSYADCNDIISYTIVIPNKGNVTSQNIVFWDTIPNGTVFESNSVFINGDNAPNTFPDLGITIPDLAPGDTTTITFSVRVRCY